MGKVQLVNFINLTLQEKQMLLSWRNNENIKKWMYNQQEISFEKHLQFIESLTKADDKRYFIVKEKNNYLGVINFCNITQKSLEMGIYKNPVLYNIGTILLDTIINYSFDILKVTKIIAELFQENQKAFSLYTKKGFVTFREKVINDKKVICMELNNENR